MPKQGEPGSEMKARDTGSNKTIPGAGKENYFEIMTILLRRYISYQWQEPFWKYIEFETTNFKV